MAYSKNQWTAGTPITAEKMMKIENELESLDNASSTAGNNIDALANEVETARDGAASLYSKIHTMDTSISNINASLATVALNSNNYMAKADYVSRIESIEDNVSDLQSDGNRYEAIENEVIAAHRNTVANDNLNQRFLDLEDAIDSNLDTRLDTLETVVGDNTSGLVKDVADNTSNLSSLTSRVGAAETAIGNKANATDVSGLATRIGSLETTVGNSNSGLVKAVADNADAIEVLQNKDTIVMTTAAFDALFNASDELISTTDVALDADYIIGPDDNNKYLYYKILQVGANYKRVLISGGGAGGTGTSSAEIVETLPSDNIDTNTDYYLQTAAGYAHYRYDETDGWVLITPALSSNINSQVATNTAAITTLQNQGRVTAITSTGTTRADNYYSFNVSYAGSNTAERVTIETPVTITNIEKSAEDDSVLIITDSTGDQRQISLPAGGGSGTSSGTLGIVRVSDQSLQTLANAEHCYISFRVVARDAIGQDITQSGTATLFINNEQRTTFTVSAAYGTEVDENDNPLRVLNTYDVLPYLASGVNSIRIQVRMNTGGETDSITSSTWTVNVINFYLTWNYDESTINDGETIRISWQPYGTNLSKTTHILVDGTEVATRVTTTNGRTEILDLDNTYSHGTHLITLYMTATINNVSTDSTSVTHSVIVVKQGNNTPIIATSLTEVTMTQYNTLRIPYTVYTPNYPESSVQRYVDGVLVSSDEGVDRTTQEWNYTPSVATIVDEEVGEPHILRIVSGTASAEISVNVEALDIPEIKEVEGYDLKLKASEIASNSALQSWRIKSNDAATQLQFSENFDWVNGGIKTEEDSNHNLRQFINVRAGSRMIIPYKPFAEDAKTNGLTMKIVFKVTRCSNYDASAISCAYTSGTSTLGFRLNAHDASLMTAAQTVSTQYGEDEYTELEFEIYKQGAAAANYAMIWLDGVMASARNYQNANFSQGANATNITIGSDDCDVQIYLIKIYKTHLSIEDHLANFIADAPNATEMIIRYNRNDILDESGEINYERLAEKNPACRVWLYDISRMTTDKKDYVTGCKFDQIYLEGGDTITNHLTGQGTLTVQGTSSVNYRKGAANTDINFKDTKNTGAPSSLHDKDGNDLLANEIPGFRINPTSTPITYANMKVNFASCEQVNNMCNAEWYQRYQPYPSLSPRDCMEFAMGVQFIRDHGVNEATGEEILFARERGAAITPTGTYDPNNKGTFDPDKYYMYSIGNLGTSKKNTHIFHSNTECCVEVKENTTLGERMIEWPENMDWTGDIKDGDHSYEMRYPDTKTPANNIKNGWERLVRWMAANNPNAATNEDLDAPVTFTPYTFRGHNRTITATEGRNFAQVLQGTVVSQYAGTYTKDTFNYRMAKMLSECEDYMAMDSIIYHFCFIERHTMVDNVAKNTFWSSNLSNQYINGVEQENTEGYWIWDLSKNYDNDTSDGNNNNGLLVFDYGNEATDTYDGTPNSATVFNGADSVWFVFASNLYEACQTMFINREALGAWSYKNYHAYLTNEQKKVPERVWNQCYWYDYLRTYEFALNNSEDTTYSTTWLSFLDGGQKIHQRSHYETYQEIYEASKYVSTVSMSEAVVLRGENISATGALAQKTDFYIQMYNKCYLTIHIGAEYQTVKCNKGETVTMSFKDSQGNPVSLSNSVINIDSGSMIQTIGDLSLLYPSSVTLGNASRLRSLQIGSDLEGYNNPNMNASSAIELNNPLLRSLYVQNLSNATYALNLSNCPELQYLKANGSGFTEYTFANGGKLNEAIIEAPTALTMRNLPSITNAKLTINDYSKLEQLWLENCVLFNDRTLIESAPALDIVRVTGMNWTGTNKITSITTLNNILAMRGLSGTGTTINQSYLQGTVRIEPEELIEQQYIIRYNEAWPNLTIDIDDNKVRKQYLVTFKYDTDTILADNISEENSIIAQYYVTEVNSDVGAYLRYNDSGTQKGLDPVALGWITPPTRKMTDQYTYTLGTYTNETYDSFSGWTYNGTRPTMSTSFKQNITLYTNFNRDDRLYNFKWYMNRNDPNSLVKTSNNIIYGGGITESAPTLLELKRANPNLATYRLENNKYYIFKGWSHLPLNITPENQNIYGEWEEYQVGSTSYGNEINLSSLSPAQLLEVTQNSTQLAKISTSDRMSIRLGYDGSDTTGRQILNENEYYRKIGRENYQSYSNEQLFLRDKAFTFVIDFKCDSNITSINPGGTSTATYESIIASCYEEDNARTHTYGFKLYYDLVNNCLRVGFGNTYGSTNRQNNTKIIGDNTTALERNIIVIRHPANSTSLYIYHGLGGSGMNNDVTEEIITDASFNATSFPLVFGACLDEQGGPIDDLTVKNMTYGYGTIYWAKVWDKDLGTGECKQLANWCHETATFGVVQTTNTNSILRVPNTNLLPRLYLSSLSASAMSGYRIEGINGSGSSTETIGWVNANYRRMLNQRIYNALPIQLQAIAYSAPYFSRHIKYEESTDQYNPGTWRLDDTSVDTIENDYISIPCYQEVSLEKVSIPLDVEANGALPWTSGSNATIWNYANNVFSPATDALSPTRYLTARFKGAPISYTPNVYKLSKSAITSGSTAYSIITRNNTLNVGDIWEPIDDATGVMYIYVGRDEINNGVPIEYTTGTTDIKYCPAGGWVASVPWWTRSYSTNINSYSGINYIYVQTNGYPQVDSTSSNRYYIDYSIGF